MKYNELEKYLFEIKDNKHATFSQSLSNSDYISIGVKNPVLRDIVKEHKNDNELKLEDFKLGKYLEVDFIYFGLALSRLSSVDEQLTFIEKNIHKAKSWAITDCVSSFIKRYSFEQYWNLFLELENSSYIYDRRMAYILGLKHYKDKNILKTFDYIKNDEEYMVMMGQAWLVATVAINYPNEVFEYLKNCKDLTLKRKSISKICDSYRFDENTKNKFKSLR